MTAASFGAVRVPKAAELVAASLRGQIITGELPADALLPAEAVLMEQFDVSRPTLREAFRILESEALIVVRRGALGGARVKPPDGVMAARHLGYLLQYRGTTMADVYRARSALERPLGEAVARDKRRQNVSRLSQAITEATPHIANPAEYARHDINFHLLVAELAGNETVRTTVEVLYHLLLPARTRYVEALAPGELGVEYGEVHRTHAYFVTLIERRDTDAAIELWNKHLDEIEHHYTARPLAKTVVEMLG
ncbi:GntR family transcriptional regulator [Mycobacterium vulneris]|uniref:GntR family transcriptional regulator n=1 Tax=Mycolicibacterium vulneris TaxID=547163 RepID=A0A1X2LCF6_9MYCO|nr:FCD domain-containing protein [Mycolicibacterium vulneris]OSC31637.1 GntR family transcriptional regulator [Mycolicibacterium vulneris]